MIICEYLRVYTAGRGSDDILITISERGNNTTTESHIHSLSVVKKPDWQVESIIDKSAVILDTVSNDRFTSKILGSVVLNRPCNIALFLRKVLLYTPNT